MLLSRALRIHPGQIVAFTGAGGKTGAIRRIAAELRPTLITTTTRLGLEQAGLALHHLVDPGPADLQRIPEYLEQQGTVLVTGPLLEGERKWTSPGDQVLEFLVEIASKEGAPLLIEADGARGRSLKAPAEHEPVVPSFADLVVPMAGLDALEKPIHSDWVHRPDRVALILAADDSAILRTREIAQLLASPEGGLKGVPRGAQVRVLLNKVETQRLDAGREIAGLLLDTPPIQAVVLASLAGEDPVHEVHGRVAAVVLAAGGSSRLGEPKQLVEWRGRPLVWHAVRAAREGGLTPVVVVLGEAADRVRGSLVGEPVNIVENPAWREGQSSSVHVGLKQVESSAEAVIFLLADQPFVGADLVQALVERYRQTLSPLVAPRAGGRRANPVLFDRGTFPALKELEGDQGGRALFEQFEASWVDWDVSVLLDLDTIEDLQRLRALE